MAIFALIDISRFLWNDEKNFCMLIGPFQVEIFSMKQLKGEFSGHLRRKMSLKIQEEKKLLESQSTFGSTEVQCNEQNQKFKILTIL